LEGEQLKLKSVWKKFFNFSLLEGGFFPPLKFLKNPGKKKKKNKKKWGGGGFPLKKPHK
jgi:hypothetical protein